MRVCFFLLAAAVALLTPRDAVSATPIFKATTSSNAQSFGIATRFLRIREGEDDGGNDDAGEERDILNLVYDRGVNLLKKLKLSAPALNTADEEAAALVKFEDKWVDSQINTYTDKYLAVFKHIHDMGYTPRQVSRMSGLAKKALSMDKKELLHDGDYMFWLYYSRWWSENVAKKAAKAA